MPQTRTHIAKKPAPAPLPMPEVLWKADEQPDIVRVPQRTVLALDGQGEPDGIRFQRAVGALYNVAYTLKFARKASHRGDFRIGPLESRWWSDQVGVPLISAPRSTWRWQLRMAVPDDMREGEVAEAAAEVQRKKFDIGEAQRVHVVTLPPQTVGRALHIGPYQDEGRTFDHIRVALAAARIEPVGRHLEIYLSDPRSTPPARLKTVLCLETKAG